MNLIPSTTAGSLAAGAPARGETLGIRPEHLKLAPGAGVEATARRIEPHGADTFIQATTAAGVDLTIRLPAGNGVRAGDQLPLLAPPAHLHHFGADGRRIA
jgi:ABC-type sugar transport system ATPase subunit